MCLALTHLQQSVRLTFQQWAQELARSHKLLSSLVLKHEMFQLMALLQQNKREVKAKVLLVHADGVNQNHPKLSIVLL